MCGIHGFITVKPHQKADDFIAQAFVTGSLRGMDASGIASINTKSGRYDIQRLVVPGFFMPQDGYAQQLMKRANHANMLTICHTRAGTTGGQGLHTTHPFLIQDADEERQIIGVHNGTLWNWNQHKDSRGCLVDSEWAFTHIFNNGMEAFKNFSGSFCFVWWDSEDAEHLNMALNKERPMHIAFTSEGGMAYASELGMLGWLMDRNEIKREGNILRLVPGNHYKFPLVDPRTYSRLPFPVVEPPKYEQHNYNRYRHKSTFEEVDELLQKIASEASSGTSSEGTANQETRSSAGNTTAVLTLRPEEVTKAQKLDLHGRVGMFDPMYLDEKSGECWGNFLADDGKEYNGIIRNAKHLEWNTDEIWECRIIGVKDGDPMELVLSKPKITKITAAN